MRKFVGGLIKLTSGDPFVITQNSAVSSTFSYTPAAGVYLCITAVGGYDFTMMLVAQSSPHVYNWIRFGTETADNNNNAEFKKIFGNGIGVFGSGGNVNSYGVCLSGMEL